MSIRKDDRIALLTVRGGVRMTNEYRLKALPTEEFAEFLFDRGNYCEYCYGICAYQDECDGLDHAQEFV